MCACALNKQNGERKEKEKTKKKKNNTQWQSIPDRLFSTTVLHIERIKISELSRLYDY